jgi:1,4-dihydroxy-6-naphthoate synthase
MKISLGFSPCPNDTFIFDALVNHKIDTKGFEFEVFMEDVETLNNWALAGKLAITKLSFNTFLQCAANYALMHAGSALGKGVGPLLITHEKGIAQWNDDASFLERAVIAIPGVNTTANLLLQLAFPKATCKEVMLFSDIEQALIDQRVDAGLIIHENRFTYQEKGLHKIKDLGDWWESTTAAAIPLGGIVAKRSLPKEVYMQLDQLIKESIAYAWNNYPSLAPFVKEHAQEMSEEVMRKHIELYVNNFSTELGEEGTLAIQTLWEYAYKAALIDNKELPIFYSDN